MAIDNTKAQNLNTIMEDLLNTLSAEDLESLKEVLNKYEHACVCARKAQRYESGETFLTSQCADHVAAAKAILGI